MKLDLQSGALKWDICQPWWLNEINECEKLITLLGPYITSFEALIYLVFASFDNIIFLYFSCFVILL